MDIEKATEAAKLVQARATYESAIAEFQTVYTQSPLGVTEVSIPRKWLPTLVELARKDIAIIDEQLAKL